MLTAVAEATAVCLPFLPRPHPLHIQRNLHVLDDEDRYLVALQVPLTLIPTPTLTLTLTLQRRIEELSLLNQPPPQSWADEDDDKVSGADDSSDSEPDGGGGDERAFVVEVGLWMLGLRAAVGGGRA